MADEEGGGAPDTGAMTEEQVAPRQEFINTLYEGTSSAEIKYYAKKERAETEELQNSQDECYYAELNMNNLNLIFNLCRDFGLVKEGGVFIDCGSGVGKQVIGASLLHSWAKCVGIEILGKLDEIGQKYLGAFKEAWETDERFSGGEWSKVEDVSLVKGNASDELEGQFGEAPQVCMLVVATTFADNTLGKISEAARNAPIGSFLVTITKACPDIDLWDPAHIQEFEAPWGTATLFIHVKESMPPSEE